MTLAEIIARITAINVRMTAIHTESRAEGVSSDVLNALSEEQDSLITERAGLQAKLIEARNLTYSPVVTVPSASNGATAARTAVTGPARYRTMEYREAFRNFIATGEANPLLRADASTTTDGVQTVIVPSVITERLFLRRTNAGTLFDRVVKANKPFGISIKTTDFFPELEWVAENAKSPRLRAETGEITFTGFKGQVRLAISLEAQTMTLEEFETALIDRILKGCRLSFDKAIVVGTGVGQPKGIITGADYTKASNVYKMNNVTIGDYSEWIKAYAKVPLVEQPYVNLMINKTDWQAKILGMKDQNGRVIALDTIGFGGALTSVFMGKEVVILENQGLKTFDAITGNATASANTAFAAFVDLDMYIFNSNLTLTLRAYIDEETDEKIHKATVIADGKLIDDNGLIVVCRDVDKTP